MTKINLEHYLQKIGLTVPTLLVDLSPVDRLKLLNDIYFAHVKTFPYSNLELRQIAQFHPVQRTPISFFNYPSLLSEERHGGFCFQTAALLADALSQIGYIVNLCAAHALLGAAVNAPEMLAFPRTHLILDVHLDENRFLLDPGLGSSSPRYPVPITETEEPMFQDGEEFRVSRIDNVYVLGKKTRQGWFHQTQSDLAPISSETAAFNMLKLQLHPMPLNIRDNKTVVGMITEQGRKSLFWDAQSDILKFSKQENGQYSQIEINDFEEGKRLLEQEFDIHHISADDLGRYCTQTVLPTPKVAWTVDFPLDRADLEKNLTPR
ncbi:arylamine N-acetyltransferase [Legionella lytica]|uniref:Arylamine N-acetyltransferase n=1 Tax=Legionella lytica TaxID=96232 RepID=A0ABW8D6X2_9GAMM